MIEDIWYNLKKHRQHYKLEQPTLLQIGTVLLQIRENIASRSNYYKLMLNSIYFYHSFEFQNHMLTKNLVSEIFTSEKKTRNCSSFVELVFAFDKMV